MLRTPVDALFPRARKQILAALCLDPGRAWFLSDLARHLGTPKTSLQRELASLEAAGILVRTVEGRQVYYRANAACPFLPELQGLFAKTAGIVDVLREALRRVPGIEVAFVYGSIARGEAVAESDVDLFLVGEAGLADIAPALHGVRQRLARPVHPTVMIVDEVSRRVTTRGFVSDVLAGPKLFVVGDEDGLGKIARTAPRREDRAGSKRDPQPHAARRKGGRRRAR